MKTVLMLKKVLKFIGKFILGFIIYVILYLLAAYLLPKITINKEANTPEEMAIYIKTNGVHTDIVVPTITNEIDWSKEIKIANTKLTDTVQPYLGMGWGDKGFYLETPTWADLKVSTAFKAAFALSTTAIHATYFKQLTENDSCKKIMISNEQYSRLVKYMLKSFQKDANNHLINIKTNAVYGNADAFYEANGSYSMFKTCNTWANNALKASGQKCCFWTPFEKGIFAKYSSPK